MGSQPAARTPAQRRRSAVATLLSFAWPGLGQAYRGDRRRALAFALPPLLLAVAIGALAVLVGPPVFIAHLLIPAYSLSAGLLVVAGAAWWAAAILDAGRPHTRPSQAVAVVALVLVVIGAGWSGSVVLSLYRAGQAIAQPIATPAAPPTASPSSGPSATPAAPGSPATAPTPAPAATPTASPAATALADERITVLFVGADLRGRHTDNNTDTILVASYDPRTERIAMISLPRDTGQVPLSDGRTWNSRINALMAYADEHPDEFPDGGIRTLQREVGHVIGIPIDYYAVVDFAGFEQLVDMVGGIDVVVDRPIADAGYYWWDDGERRGFFLEEGEHHLDGAQALAYARSRHGPGNSDFRRARRQQEVLLALRDRIDDPLVLANLPSIVDAAARMVRTDVPLDRLPQIVGLLQQSTGAQAENYVLRPPTYAEVIPQSEIGRIYMTRLKLDAVAALSIQLFGDESRYAQEQE